MNEFTKILTSGQVDRIKKEGPVWFKAKIDEELVKAIIDPYDFELAQDGISWLRNGTLSLCMVNSATNYRGDAIGIEVQLRGPFEEQYMNTSTKLCHLLMKTLQKFSSSNYHFPQVFKYKYSIWRNGKVQQWLIDDLCQETDWAGCLNIKQQKDGKLIASMGSGQISYGVDLKFNSEGCVEIKNYCLNLLNCLKK